MESIISATDLVASFSDILNRIHQNGERFIVERDGEPIAVLAPAQASSGITLHELIEQIGNLELPGDGFADDLEAIQRSQSMVGMPPWPN